MTIKVLDLFSGTKSVSKGCEFFGDLFEVTTLDLNNADICTDIMDWDYESEYEPEHFDIIWASVPCVYFSNLRRCNIGRFNITAQSIEDDIQNKGVPLLRKTEEVINYFKPKYYFIENGATTKLKDYIQLNPEQHFTVDYCQYATWGYRKRTRIWTNLKSFEPWLCDKKCAGFENGKHRLQVNSIGGGSDSSVNGNRTCRSRVPPKLIQALLKGVIRERYL